MVFENRVLRRIFEPQDGRDSAPKQRVFCESQIVQNFLNRGEEKTI